MLSTDGVSRQELEVIVGAESFEGFDCRFGCLTPSFLFLFLGIGGPFEKSIHERSSYPPF